jgi:hypothetical protein
MEILNRFVSPFVFPLIPDIPVGIRVRFIGKIPFKEKITPSKTITFVCVVRVRIPENFMYGPGGYKGANPQICITCNIINNYEVFVKRNSLFNDDVVNHIDPRRGVYRKRVKVPESCIIGCPLIVLQGKTDPVYHFIESGKEEAPVMNKKPMVFSGVATYCRRRVCLARCH